MTDEQAERMKLVDTFAAHALTGLLSKGSLGAGVAAVVAYEYAIEMMDMRAKIVAQVEAPDGGEEV